LNNNKGFIDEEKLSANFNIAYKDYKELFLSRNQLYSYFKSFSVYAVDSKRSIFNLTAQLKASHSESISNYTETRVKAYKAVDNK
jgi:hypothetical protein